MPPTESATSSIARAFAVLRAVAGAGASLGVSEIARRTGLPKSTVARLVRTLEEQEALERVAGDGRYRVGAGLTRLTAGRAVPGQVRDVARPALRELVDELEEDAGLAVPDGRRMLFVDQVSVETPVKVPDWSGQRLPYHAAAAGYVLLADMPGHVVEDLLAEGLEPWTSRTTTDEALVRRRIEDARRRGLAWLHDEWARGINGIAVPVRERGGDTVAAINLYGPSYRFPGARAEQDIERRVVATARAIGDALTTEPPPG